MYRLVVTVIKYYFLPYEMMSTSNLQKLGEENHGPISDMEFMDHVYHFDNPADLKFKVYEFGSDFLFSCLWNSLSFLYLHVYI